MKRIFSVFITICLLSCLLFCAPTASQNNSPQLVLVGQRTLPIPSISSRTFAFTAYLLDENNDQADAALELDISGTLPDGVEFDRVAGTVKVHDYALAGDRFIISVSAPEEYGIPQKDFTITLTEDVLVNGSFYDYPSMSGWNTYDSSPLVLEDDVVSFTPIYDELSSYEYFLCQENAIYLEADTLYVLRAKVRSEKGYPADRAHATNYALVENGTLTLNLFDIGGEDFNEVYCAFRMENTGIYNVQICFQASDSRPIYVKELTLLRETTKPSKIVFSAPGAINAPKTPSFSLPFMALVLDQEGNVLSTTPTISVSPTNQGIEIDESSKSIIVYDSVKPDYYELSAELEGFPNTRTTHIIRVTDSGIDDGGFDENPIGVTWMPISPSRLSLQDDNRGNKYALFEPLGDVGVLYNNSYVSFEHEQSYVFSLDLKKRFSDIDTAVTVLIEDITNPDNLILAGYVEPSTDWHSYRCIFTPEESIVGRLIIAINTNASFDEQLIYIDNVSVDSAIIEAQNVQISGRPVRGQTLKGSYKFINNFDAENASITNWLVSDTKNGEYKPLSNTNIAELDVTEYIEGKYVQFCVTPISLTAGLIGHTEYSDPVYIAEHITDSDGDASIEDTPPVPSVNPDIPVIPVPTAPSVVPVNLNMFSYAQNSFADMDSHWAKKDVSVMAAAGIVSGYADKTFNPELPVTRAEFSALLMRALGLSEYTYTGRFADVSPESWYAGVVQTVCEAGLAGGVSNTQFAPNKEISREQIAVMLMRAYALVKVPPSYTSPAFLDTASISEYARESVYRANTLNIVLGTPDLRFEPSRSATRAEAVVMIRRLLNCLAH